MKLMGRLGVLLVVWVVLVFAASNTVDQPVFDWLSDTVGIHYDIYDYADPTNRHADDSGLSIIQYYVIAILWSHDIGNDFPEPTPAPGDTIGIIGSYDPEYAASPGAYGSNASHKGYYFLFSDTLISYTNNSWQPDTLRPLPKPAASQGMRGPEDSVSVSIENPVETRYPGQTSYDVLGYDVWVDTSGTGTPDAYAQGIHLGFYPVLGGAGAYTLFKWWPADYFPDETKTCYHAYYLVATPALTTDQEEGYMTYYLSENAEPVVVVGIAEQKDAVPMHMSLNAAPSITRDRAAINYALTKTTAVTIAIYNASGQVVSTLVDGVQAAGEHTVMFDGTDMPSGVYFCQLLTPDKQLQTKLTMLR